MTTWAKRIGFVILVVIVAVLSVGIATAADIVNQGAGSRAVTPWRVSLATPGGSAAMGTVPLAPGVPTNVAASTISAAATGFTAGAILRIVCSIDTFYRVGSGTPTAVTTDNDLPARVIEYIMLPTGMTAIAFVTASGTGTCKVAIIPVL